MGGDAGPDIVIPGAALAVVRLYTDAIDTVCLRQWLQGPFGMLTITAGDTLRQELPMHGQCPWYETPCVSYHGPLPP